MGGRRVMTRQKRSAYWLLLLTGLGLAELGVFAAAVYYKNNRAGAEDRPPAAGKPQPLAVAEPGDAIACDQRAPARLPADAFAQAQQIAPPPSGIVPAAELGLFDAPRSSTPQPAEVVAAAAAQRSSKPQLVIPAGTIEEVLGPKAALRIGTTPPDETIPDAQPLLSVKPRPEFPREQSLQQEVPVDQPLLTVKPRSEPRRDPSPEGPIDQPVLTVKPRIEPPAAAPQDDALPATAPLLPASQQAEPPQPPVQPLPPPTAGSQPALPEPAGLQPLEPATAAPQSAQPPATPSQAPSEATPSVQPPTAPQQPLAIPAASREQAIRRTPPVIDQPAVETLQQPVAAEPPASDTAQQPPAAQPPQPEPPKTDDIVRPLPPLMANTPSKVSPPVRTDLTPARQPIDLDAAMRPAEIPSADPGLPLAPRLGGGASKLPPPVVWQEPKLLLDRLADLKSPEAAARWAADTARLVRALGPALAKGSPEAKDIIARLDKAIDAADAVAGSTRDVQTARKVRQAGYAVMRRLIVWDAVAKLGGQSAEQAGVAAAHVKDLAMCLNEIESITQNSAEGDAWRRYLLVDNLRSISDQRRAIEDVAARELARQTLERLARAPLSAEQRFFVSSGPVFALRNELRCLAAEPISSTALMAHLEQYEASREPSAGRLLARDTQYLTVSTDPTSHELGQNLNNHYRNANLRMCVSAELINRLMPKRDPELAPVRDHVLGVPVRGQSLTSTALKVKLIPDPSRVRLSVCKIRR
jgi:hypothetical protein